MEREVVKSTGRMYKTSCSSIISPTSRKVQMGGKVNEGNANFRGGKVT
jgi:hypothetical protein